MPLDLMPGSYRLIGGAIAIAAILGAAWVSGDRHGLAKGRAEVAELRAQWTAERQAEQQAALDAVQATRVEERRRADEQERIAHDADLAASAARSDAVRAASAGAGLRVRAAAVAADCRPAPVNPAASAPGPAASAPGDLLADVLGRIADAAGQLAAVADQRGAAGTACERAYRALTP